MIAQRLMTPRILWAALLFSTLMLGVLPYVATLPDQPPNPILLPVFGAVALGQVVLGLVFPETAMRKSLATRLTKLIVERPNPAAEVTFREAAPPIKACSNVKSDRMAWRTLTASAVTSGPMPSPASTAILWGMKWIM